MTRRFRRKTIEEIAFEREVARAVSQLPEWVHEQLANVAIVVEERPAPDQVQDMEEGLYALYEGMPLGVDPGPFPLPARIVIFREPLTADFGQGTRLRREIRRTILHEVGHHFGMTEEQIARLGYE